MGRPYAQDVAALPSAYRRGIESDSQSLADALGQSKDLPLVAVGSGGALTLGELAALYQQRLFGRPATAVTPLMLAAAGRSLSHCAVLIVSARGTNSDVLGALQTALIADAKRIIVLCGNRGSPLANLAAAHPHVDLIEIQKPGRTDGFLATGSLFSLGAMLAAAFGTASHLPDILPTSLDDLLADYGGLNGLSAHLKAHVAAIWDRRYFIALHDAMTRPAITDLESKLSETALRPVQAVDYRNFAHGRHFWLARHADQTAVISIESADCLAVANETLRLIGDRVPCIRMAFHGSLTAAPLAAIAAPVLLTGLLGKHLGIDPGRPGVPLFGRRLYHLRPLRSSVPQKHQAAVQVAIERKTGTSFAMLKATGRDSTWVTAHRSFVQHLHEARFGAIAFDYDGTLCERRHRFDPLDKRIRVALIQLLERGVVIGIATGRGKSVRKVLQEALPKKHWKRVLVGYYNGGHIGTLAENGVLHTGEPTGPLRKAWETLSRDSSIADMATLEARSYQVTISPKPGTPSQALWQSAMHLMYSKGLGTINVVRSSHSIDVLAPGVSKRHLLSTLKRDGGEVLAIGDSGCWPGNDFELLATPFGLSVDEVSPDPTACWNLGLPSTRGTMCCLYYCSRLTKTRKSGEFRLFLREHVE